MAVLFVVILHKEKKKTKEFYKKNGCPTLEKANVIKLFKKEELKPILKSSNLIGKGCFGEVYKGLLDNKNVAIKKPINGSVLESSLHDILHKENNKVPLNLDTRLNIIAQSADGLAYMHSKANIKILHGDVKPANILLDDNFVPKISDFGISRLIARDKEHTTSIIGDMSYMDPVYLQEGLLTKKSDVYSFGVVILELISRRRAMHSDNNKLVKNFLEAHKKQKKATEFFDKEIAMTEDLELLDSLAGLAVECLSLDVDERPTMMEVAERLLILGRSRKLLSTPPQCPTAPPPYAQTAEHVAVATDTPQRHAAKYHQPTQHEVLGGSVVRSTCRPGMTKRSTCRSGMT
uniref:Wall-associated receptor kinase 3 n=1 Tax=Aegilops tauschii TaxID=37682 RepID=M8AY93_AEGTA